MAGEVIACSIVPACGVNALAGLPVGAICSHGKRARPGSCDRLEVVAQTDQVHIAKVVGAGGKHVFVVNAETVIQLEANPQTVIDTLIVAAVHIFQTVAHKVRLNRFNSVLIDREFIARKIFNPPGVTGKVIMHIGLLAGEEVLIPAAAEGEGPVIRGPAQRGTDDILVIGFAVGA